MGFQMIRCAFCNEDYCDSEITSAVLITPKKHKTVDRLYACCPECINKGFARQPFDDDNFVITAEGIKHLLSENKRFMAGLAADTAILEQALPVATERDSLGEEVAEGEVSGVPV